MDRFWSKVEITPGCWEWTASLTRTGYGKFWDSGKVRRAHIVSYEMHKGEIPSGMMICHSCDNRKCVNPGHLWTGTAKDNTADAKAKGRLRGRYSDLGDKCPNGHEYSDRNTSRRADGSRRCRACAAASSKKLYHAKKLLLHSADKLIECRSHDAP